MQLIKFKKKCELSTFTYSNDNEDLYVNVIKQYPFVKGYLTGMDWKRYYKAYSFYAIYEYIDNNNLLNGNVYYIGKINYNNTNLFKFSNGLYGIISRNDKYEVIKIVNLPDELFKM